MKIKYNIEKLKNTLYNLSVLTNIPISFVPIGSFNSINLFESGVKAVTDSAFCRYIQRKLNMQKNCYECDKKILNYENYKSHICHAGLYDATFPVVKNGVTTGYLLFGCLRCASSPEIPYGITDEKAIELYKKRPFFTDEQIESLKNLLPDILLDDAIIIEYSDIINEIDDYIKDNLSLELKIEHICKKFHISKNTLYKLFDEHFSATPNSYILTKRIEKAKKLIPDKSISINEAAAKSGFTSYPHFCRAFKKHTGLSPSEFRKTYK
ncbi:MAG: helix-turn-helix domain-containing protein [Clostridia bacterium]|nr:helix-turn-helix domain-containing protein [Clostridia bacterium]